MRDNLYLPWDVGGLTAYADGVRYAPVDAQATGAVLTLAKRIVKYNPTRSVEECRQALYRLIGWLCNA